MLSLSRIEAATLWNAWWNNLKEEWFKVEVLQDYTAEDNCPSLQLWLEGKKDESIALMHNEMKEWIEECKKNPAQKIRIHIVEEPYTKYLEWELELYKRAHIPIIGEQVSIISKQKVEHLSIPKGDFMIFDQKKAIQSYYSKEGLMESMDFYDEGEDIENFLKLREELLRISNN